MKAFEPYWILRLYCATSFAIGTGFSIFVASLIQKNELEMSSGMVLALTWNVLFLMILPIILDWSERKYCRARFIEIEEIANTNPELKKYLDEQCKKLSLSQLRLAITETTSTHCFTYGLWRHNPRLFIPAQLIEEQNKVLPSIEIELSRFARQDLTILFLIFCSIQIAIQLAINYFIK